MADETREIPLGEKPVISRRGLLKAVLAGTGLGVLAATGAKKVGEFMMSGDMDLPYVERASQMLYENTKDSKHLHANILGFVKSMTSRDIKIPIGSHINIKIFYSDQKTPGPEPGKWHDIQIDITEKGTEAIYDSTQRQQKLGPKIDFDKLDNPYQYIEQLNAEDAFDIMITFDTPIKKLPQTMHFPDSVSKPPISSDSSKLGAYQKNRFFYIGHGGGDIPTLQRRIATQYDFFQIDPHSKMLDWNQEFYMIKSDQEIPPGDRSKPTLYSINQGNIIDQATFETIDQQLK